MRPFLVILLALFIYHPGFGMTVPAKPITEKLPASKPASSSSKPVPEIKVGDDLVKALADAPFKNTESKIFKLSSLIKNKKSLIILVKPGCIFCESMLAVANGIKPELKLQSFMILDSKHASLEDLKSKSTNYNNIGTTWFFDVNAVFQEKLGMQSYPRFIVVDEKGKIKQIQIGLVMPEDKKSLEQKEFNEVLQELAELTIGWMQGL